MKINFKKPETPVPEPPVVIPTLKLFMQQESRLGINQDGTPFRVLRFEAIIGRDEEELILSNLSSDGSVTVRVFGAIQ